MTFKVLDNPYVKNDLIQFKIFKRREIVLKLMVM